MAVTSICQSYSACTRIVFEEFLISTRVVAFLKFESICSRLQILSYFLHYIIIYLPLCLSQLLKILLIWKITF